MLCCVVRQDSLDIEQFSYKVAVIICKCQGYKFRFCNDYDIEIVDVSSISFQVIRSYKYQPLWTYFFFLFFFVFKVCPLNGDILAIVFLRINADPPTIKTTSESK